MQRLIAGRSSWQQPGTARRRPTRGWIEGGGAALSSQAKDGNRSVSDESCPARPCVRAERRTYTVGLLANRLLPWNSGHDSMTEITGRQPVWRAQ